MFHIFTFKKGLIGKREWKSPVGEKRLSNSGFEMEIIAYRGYNDIDVKFSDGSTRKGVSSTVVLRKEE